jgi:hypothetical protein
LIIGGLVAASGCSIGDPPTVPPPIIRATPSNTETTDPAADCPGVVDTVRDHLGSQTVTVEVTGQCTTVVILTPLTDADGDEAVELCNTAAEVAYTGDINSIRVLSASGDELSQGVANLKCLP